VREKFFAAARQLGHSSPAITCKSHFAKPAIAADVAHFRVELVEACPADSSNTSGIA
jgi:hypothetical protein